MATQTKRTLRTTSIVVLTGGAGFLTGLATGGWTTAIGVGAALTGAGIATAAADRRASCR